MKTHLYFYTVMFVSIGFFATTTLLATQPTKPVNSYIRSSMRSVWKQHPRAHNQSFNKLFSDEDLREFHSIVEGVKPGEIAPPPGRVAALTHYYCDCLVQYGANQKQVGTQCLDRILGHQFYVRIHRHDAEILKNAEREQIDLSFPVIEEDWTIFWFDVLIYFFFCGAFLLIVYAIWNYWKKNS